MITSLLEIPSDFQFDMPKQEALYLDGSVSLVKEEEVIFKKQESNCITIKYQDLLKSHELVTNLPKKRVRCKRDLQEAPRVFFFGGAEFYFNTRTGSQK